MTRGSRAIEVLPFSFPWTIWPCRASNISTYSLPPPILPNLLNFSSFSVFLSNECVALSSLSLSRGYNYRDQIVISPERLANYGQCISKFFEEHLHNDDEIRYIRAGEGYFDVRSKALISGSVLPSFAFVNASASADPLNATSAFGLPFPPSVSLPPVLAALFPDLNISTPITLTAAHQEDVNSKRSFARD